MTNQNRSEHTDLGNTEASQTMEMPGRLVHLTIGEQIVCARWRELLTPGWIAAAPDMWRNIMELMYQP